MDTKKICPGCLKPLAPTAPDGLCPACLMKAGAGTGADIGPDSQGESGRTPFIAPTPDEVARLFPQLEILGFIGQGGMGAVYKARQKALDRVVALKILPPGIGKDPAFAERFTREAKALARLNHPGVVTLYEFGQADGLFFFLMEFVDGMSLRHLLEVERISAREALAIVPQICDALQYAHDQGIVHRDIKPENILLDRRGRVKVADFGLAKLVGTDALTPALSHPMGEGSASVPGEGTPPPAALTDADKVMGTPQYMAPEQREHPADVDHRADIYALGVVFYQMLTGELPGKPIEPPSKKVQIDVRLDEVVLRALEKSPELRYQQVSEVKTAVETIAATASASAPPAEPGVAPGATTENKSGFVRLFETLSGSAFTSPLAIKLINVSALGFLGFLGSLGFLGYGPPGWHWCFRFFGFSGFFGFFGLIGAAFIAEASTQATKERTAWKLIGAILLIAMAFMVVVGVGSVIMALAWRTSTKTSPPAAALISVPAAAIAAGTNTPEAVWETRVATMNEADWREALAVAQKIAALPPEEGLAVVRAHWITVTNAESRKQFVKAFVFANHPRTLGVIHLGLQDPSPAVQSWALTYLKGIALRDFADDYAAAQAWVEARKDRSLREVMKASAREAAELLQGGRPDAVRSLLTLLSMPTQLRGQPDAVQGSGLEDALERIINGRDESLSILALRTTVGLKFSEAWCRRVLLPRLSPSYSVEARGYAATALGWCAGDWAVNPLLNALTNSLSDTASMGRLQFSPIASALAEIGSARAIPTMIAIIEADNTYSTVYGVGYFGLGKLTGVQYDEKHDGAWWRAWWNKNKQRFPAEVRAMEIPRFVPVTKSPRANADKAG